MRRLIIVLLVVVIGPILAADRMVVQTGHIDKVTKISMGNRELVSISDDGSLRVWDPASKSLSYKVQTGPLPLVNITLHPTEPRAAVIASDGISIHQLSVWDWSSRRLIFSRDLDTLPLYLSFSPKGTFLVYTNAEWQSTTVIDAKTGGKLPYITNGFGIVTGFRISSSEQRLAMYLPSGSIQYRNLRSGSVIQEFATVADIDAVQFVMANRYMIGVWEDSLIAIDLLSGEDMATVRVPGLISFDADEETGGIICLTDGQGPAFKSYTFTGTTFRSKNTRYIPPEGLSSNYVVARNSLYSGTDDGTLFVQSSYSSLPRIFGSDRLAPVHDFDSLSSVILSTTASIVTIYADYLYADGFTGGAGQVLTHVQDNPLQAPATVQPLGGGTYVLQDDTGERGMYWLFSPVEGAIGFPNDSYQAPIVSTDTKNQKVLTVDSDGTIQIFDLQSGEFVFDTRIFGLQTAIYVHGDNIVASGRRSQTLRSSKLLIDTTTGETVALDDVSLETFILAYEPLSHTLYALSIEGAATDSRTVLTQYTGPTFENQKEIFSMPGTHKEATMSVSRGTLFLSSGGVNRALYAGTGRFVPVESNDNIPVKVEVMDDWLIGLNQDSSLSVWNRATGNHALDFYLFNDLEWVAITASGAAFTSADSIADYVKEFRIVDAPVLMRWIRRDFFYRLAH